MGKVFISYSHDSPEHSARVLELSNRLCAMGVDAELDRYHVRPPRGWPHWCEEQLRPEVSSFVLVVCTQTYRARIEGRVGADEGRGVYWEGAILYNYLYNAKGNSRFIPVLIGDAQESGVPPPLDGHTRYRIRAFDLSDPGFEGLYRELTGQPETPKPALGHVVRLDAGGPPDVASPLPQKPVVTDFPAVAPGGATSAADAPSPPAADTPEAASPFVNFLSPFSSEESVARGEVRFWAIIETLAAMAVFWWAAIRFETFGLLTSSLFVAPMLLLRSEESTRLGVKWFDDGMFPARWPADLAARAKAEQRWALRVNWIGAAIGIAVGLGLGYPAARAYFVGSEGWDAFGRGMGFGLVAAWLAGAGVVAGVIAVTGGGAGAAAGAAAGEAAGEAAMSAAIAAVGTGAIAAAAAGGRIVAVAGAGMEAAATAWATAGVRTGTGVMVGTTKLAVSAVVLVFMIAPAWPLGLWLATLTCRMAATARHAPEGYRRLPTNVRRVALCMSPLQQAELLPGLPSDHELRFSAYFARAASNLDNSKLGERLAAHSIFTFSLFIYVSAWVYRFILKSTLWFWWILLIVGGAPKLDGGIEGLRADAYRKASAWTAIATAVFVFVDFVFGSRLRPWAEVLTADAPLPAAAARLVLVDWKSISILQWVTLASALATVAVVIWTRDLYVDWQNSLRVERVKAQLPWLGHLVKWKTGFGVAGIALLMLYFALYANAVQHYLPVSDWEAGWLRWLYGAAADRLRPGGI